MPNVDTAVVKAALSLKTGGSTPQPIKIYNGYALVEAVSTSDDHPDSEAAAYAKAQADYQRQEAHIMIPRLIVSLIKKSSVTYYVHS